MIQSTNQVSLYRKIDEDIIQAMEIKIASPKFFYNNSEGVKAIEIPIKFDGILLINEYDTEWAPNENDLKIKQKFTITNPKVLFGEDGVTLPSNKIGIAVHTHSKTSNLQKKESVYDISYTEDPIEFELEIIFSKDSLRGSVDLDFFFYLQEVVKTLPHQANKVGMRLSEQDLYNLTIVVDGEGSAFPITEFSDKNGPLWKMEKNWADAREDIFDIANVNLSLNIAHPLFEQVKAGKTNASRALMGDIMVQAMAMIIQQVLIVEKNSLDDIDENSSNSILAIVGYWVSTFNVDVTSIFSITNSLRENLERDMMGRVENG